MGRTPAFMLVPALMLAGCLQDPVAVNPSEASGADVASGVASITEDFAPGVHVYIVNVTRGGLTTYAVDHNIDDAPLGSVGALPVNFLVPLNAEELDLFPVGADFRHYANWSHAYQFRPGNHYWYAASAMAAGKEFYVNPNDMQAERSYQLGGPVTREDQVNLTTGRHLWVFAGSAPFRVNARLEGAEIVSGPLSVDAWQHTVFSRDHWNAETYASSSGPLGPEIAYGSGASYELSIGAKGYVFVQALGENVESRVTLTAPGNEAVRLIEKVYGGKAAVVSGVGVAQTYPIIQADLMTARAGEWRIDVQEGFGYVDVRAFAFTLPAV